MTTLTYFGTPNFNEKEVTGRIVTWTTGQTQDVDDSVADLLLNVGGFVESETPISSNNSLFSLPSGDAINDVGINRLYWGPCTGRSSLPKASSVPKYTYGYVGQILVEGGKKFRGVVALIHGVQERMKAIAEGTTNGYGDFKASLIYNGKVYPGYVVDTVNRFWEVTSRGVSVDTSRRIGRCMYGDVMSFEFDLGDDYIPAGAEVFYKIAGVQVGHNDSGAFAPGQFMCYGNRVRGRDVFAYGTTGLSAGNYDTWLADVDTVTVPTSLAGQAGNFIGFSFHSLLALTTKPTKAVAGDSRNHGPSNEATGNSDQGFDLYGLTGEICNIVGTDYGCSNCGMQTEKFTDITLNPTTSYIGRKKLFEMCTDGTNAYVYNDMGDAPFTGELTTVAAYQSNFDILRTVLPRMRTWALSTVSPSVTSINYITDYQTQNSIRDPRTVGLINGAIRSGAIVGADSFYDPASAVSETEDGFTVLVPADAKTVNTGTGTITVSAATGSLPAITTLSLTAAPFTKRMEGYYISIVGAGSSGGVLRAQIQYVNTTDVRLIVRNSEDNPIAITASMLNGGSSPLALTMSTNIAYIGAENLTVDSATSGAIHFNTRGYRLMRQYNKAMGLV